MPARYIIMLSHASSEILQVPYLGYSVSVVVWDSIVFIFPSTYVYSYTTRPSGSNDTT